MHIGVVLESQRQHFNYVDCRAAIAAVAHQLRYDAAPRWDRVAPSLSYYSALANVPQGAHIIAVIDDPDVANALGYHDETPDGRPYGRVFVAPVLDNGGSALHGSLSVSAVLSHEALEMLGDPLVNLWADDWRNNRQVACELCDPVEADSYRVPTTYGGASVSDFVLPSWFDDIGGAAPFSFMDGPAHAFGMTPGGYMLVRAEGTVRQVFATSYPPSEPGVLVRGLTKTHPASRTWLRRTFVTGAPT